MGGCLVMTGGLGGTDGRQGIRGDACNRESDARTDWSRRLVAQWPHLPHQALGLWCAWSIVAFSGSTWLSLDWETDAAHLSAHYVFTTLFTGVILTMVAACLRRRGSVSVGNRAVIAGGIVASLCCLAVILIGPHYLGAGREFVGLFWGICSIAGLSMGVVLLRCGDLYGSLSPRNTLVNVGSTQIIAASVFFLMHSCSLWEPVSGGPPLAGILAYVLLPVMAAGLSCLSTAEKSEGAASALSPGAAESCIPAQPHGATGVRRLPMAYWHLVVLTLVVALVTSMVRGLAVGEHTLAVTTDGTCILSALRVLLGGLLMFVAVFATSEGLRLGRLLTLILAVSSSIIVIAAPMAGLTGAWGVLSYALAIAFDALQWALLAFVVRQKGVSPLVVFGYGRGVFSLGCAVGWAAGMWLVPSLSPAVQTTVLVTGGFAMAASCLAVFSETDFEQLFLPSGQGELSLPDLLDLEDRRRRVEAEEAGQGGSKRGRFRRTVEALGSAAGLSGRERDVFRLLAMGYGSDRIADELGLSPNTVRVHTHSIYVKIDVHSRAELMDLVDADIARASSRQG